LFFQQIKLAVDEELLVARQRRSAEEEEAE